MRKELLPLGWPLGRPPIDRTRVRHLIKTYEKLSSGHDL